MRKSIATIILLSVITSAGIFAQAPTLTIPRPSPTTTISQEFGTSKIQLVYSRPSVKGRTIFGDLVPFGEVWRTGANAATKITFGADVTVEGKNVPKGKYALYTIPEKESWTVILHKDTTLWGAEGYKPENELLRFTVKPWALSMPVETFTIDFNNIKPNSCDVLLLWDKTGIRFNIMEEIDSKIMAQIDEAMKSEKPPYWQAANYYFENGKDINKAYDWVNKAIEARPEAYWMMTAKAKMEMKMGLYNNALTTATKARELAVKDNDNSYIQQNDKTIAEAKAKL